MKRAILSVLLLFAFLTGFAQNRNICRLGITYDISQSDHWGKNKPVITSVIPYSPAELAGVKTNDIIIAIDGVQTTDISSEEIGEMLNPAGKNEVLLTIGNLANPAKQVLVKKECKKGNAITEEQLATAFSMYSLETTSEREFVCPFKTTVTADPVD
ncbi:MULTISPECIES: PDZ domain-containing protein, partial [unclassified Parabacteroides]